MHASNEQNRDQSNVPGGASGTFGTGREGEDRTKQSTGIEQELTVNQSDAQQQEDRPSSTRRSSIFYTRCCCKPYK